VSEEYRVCKACTLQIEHEVNNHPHSGWLETCPIGAFFKGKVSAMDTLFTDPSPRARVYMKTIKGS